MSSRCPVCEGSERYYAFVVADERFDECRDCGLLAHKAVNGVEASEALAYGGGSVPVEVPELLPALLGALDRYVGPGPRRLGVLGAAPAGLGEAARRRGFEPLPIAEGDRRAADCEAVLVLDLLENAASPVEFLEAARGWLRPGGVLAVVTRQLLKTGERAGGRVLEQRQRYAFSDENLQTVMWKAGFGDLFLAHHGTTEAGLQRAGWRKDRAIAFGRMRDRRATPRLSVVTPVFNEAATVREVLDALATRSFPGLDLEVVVVESNSTDGSREIVRAFEGHPRFRVLYQDRPRGKGHAVRAGLAQVTGDVVLIQDADLEYDFLDYAMLLRPILDGRAAFVLGTRHAGHWKIRRFAQHRLADLMNLAHWGLVFLMNRLYGQAMTDPFTMFKVFRADCLAGLDFECNRFDFDIEIVCKLLRKGYTPLEIPVNYQARSFEEGKKVRIFRDPLTWLRAMWKYRSAPVVRMPAPREPSGSGGDAEGAAASGGTRG